MYTVQQYNEHIQHMKFSIRIYQYICMLNEEPTDRGKSLVGLSNSFFHLELS